MNDDDATIEDLCEAVTTGPLGGECGGHALMSCPSCARRFCYECAVEHVRDCAGWEAPDAAAS